MWCLCTCVPHNTGTATLQQLTLRYHSPKLLSMHFWTTVEAQARQPDNTALALGANELAVTHALKLDLE